MNCLIWFGCLCDNSFIIVHSRGSQRLNNILKLFDRCLFSRGFLDYVEASWCDLRPRTWLAIKWISCDQWWVTLKIGKFPWIGCFFKFVNYFPLIQLVYYLYKSSKPPFNYLDLIKSLFFLDPWETIRFMLYTTN